MGILVITVDLECCRCRSKITKVLDCLKEEFCIEKVEFDDKNKKVVVRGKYDAEKLCKKVWSKAGKIVKEIVIAEVWPMPPAPKPCKPPCKEECCCKPPAKPEEKPKPKPPVKCDCDHCCKPCKVKCEPEKKPDPKPPPAPKTEYKLVPYPYPYPLSYPMTCPSWPQKCPPQQQCQGCKPPPPPPPPPCSCSSSSHGNCSCHGVWPPQPPVWPHQPPFWPPPAWSSCNVVTDDNYSCSVM